MNQSQSKSKILGAIQINNTKNNKQTRLNPQTAQTELTNTQLQVNLSTKAFNSKMVYHQKMPEFAGESGFTSHYAAVKHTAERMSAVADTRGIGEAEVTVHYADTEARELDNGHIVLVHPTGMSSRYFLQGDNLAKMFHDAGFRVTLVDIRGHGLTTVTKGPYTVPLLAEDVSSALRVAYPDTPKFHLFGVSVGFGTVMAMSVNHPEMVHTLSGNGFLFDRSRRDMAAYIFSRRSVITMLGVRRLASLIPVICKCPEISKNVLQQASYVPLGGYIGVSQSWLGFNLSNQLGGMQVPILMIVPQYDENIGHTRKLSQKELDLMPETLMKELHYVEKYSHLMSIQEGGGKILSEKVIDFIKRTSTA